MAEDETKAFWSGPSADGLKVGKEVVGITHLPVAGKVELFIPQETKKKYQILGYIIPALGGLDKVSDGVSGSIGQQVLHTNGSAEGRCGPGGGGEEKDERGRERDEPRPCQAPN